MLGDTTSRLHTQARTAHRKAGTYLADRARDLEAEVKNSRQTLAAALAPDGAESSSSTRAFVMSSIGLGECIDIPTIARGTGANVRDETAGSLGGYQSQKDARGLSEAMMRAEVSSRWVPKTEETEKTPYPRFSLRGWTKIKVQLCTTISESAFRLGI